MILICARARLAPRQKCGAAAAEGQVVVRRAARVEHVRVGEVVGIAVGRRVEDDDLVALP